MHRGAATLTSQRPARAGKDFIGVGVGAVVLDQARILLLKRLREPEAGCWGIAGGAVEFGESIEAAILREMREELAVECQIVALLGVSNHILPAQSLHWVSPIFLVRIVSGTPYNREQEKHSDLCWFKLDALPDRLTLPTQAALRWLN